ncbi:MAG: ParB/RepB/Spo0J family partition protein [Phycisphaerales bacterium]|nr:ParB/RepB/Spo0J family partition protein [Phycisphaerales bacterium]
MKTQKSENVALESIDFPPQVRRKIDEAALAGLEASIRAIGVQQPVLLRLMESGRYVPLDGERRCRVSLLVGLATIPACVITDPLEAAEIVERQLAINMAREALHPLDVARGIDALLKEPQRTAAQVAAALGMSPATVSRQHALLTLAPEILEMIERAEIPVSVGYELTCVKDPQERLRLAQLAASGATTRDGISQERKRQDKPAGSPGRNGPIKFTAQLGAGRTIAIRGPGLDAERAIQWLEELIARLRKVRSQNLALPTFAKMLKDQSQPASAKPSSQGTAGC